MIVTNNTKNSIHFFKKPKKCRQNSTKLLRFHWKGFTQNDRLFFTRKEYLPFFPGKQLANHMNLSYVMAIVTVIMKGKKGGQFMRISCMGSLLISIILSIVLTILLNLLFF